MEEALVECLWSECQPGVRRSLKFRCRTDVRAAVQAVRVRHFVEWFCGTGSLTTACSQLGLCVSWCAWTLDSVNMNLLPSGMAAAILLALSIVIGGTAWFGVPCSTLVFMSRGHTK